MNVTQDQLRIKGFRAYFSIKNMIDLTSITKKCILKLFDSLIVPVVSYGCAAWLTTTSLLKAITKNKSLSSSDIMAQIASDPMEKLHISFMKWTLGVTKRTSNVPVWGDFGRTPLGTRLIKQLLDYHNRLVQLDIDNSN